MNVSKTALNKRLHAKFAVSQYEQKDLADKPVVVARGLQFAVIREYACNCGDLDKYGRACCYWTETEIEFNGAFYASFSQRYTYEDDRKLINQLFDGLVIED
jgi:hypothetical protein